MSSPVVSMRWVSGDVSIRSAQLSISWLSRCTAQVEPLCASFSTSPVPLCRKARRALSSSPARADVVPDCVPPEPPEAPEAEPPGPALPQSRQAVPSAQAA
ncbi:hypothetical protein [Cryobacterium breve]|uniref:hypothetical protein n=1 Tax=Cryobacterium breve TaxID=1259258 RepID=UPI00248CABA4|nr:hypothetical protein [Cryobacterium breve]